MDSSHFLKNKKNLKGELIVILFEYCNLSCQMCGQNHSDKNGINNIREKIHSIKKSMLSIKNSGKTSLAINLMGGELFQDFLDDDIFSDYEYLIDEINYYSNEITIPTTISISTNLVFNKVERVKKFLDKVKINISVSYDPAGRFNILTFETFKKNVKYFKEYISQVGVVMTKPTIERFLKKKTPFFDYIYENFEVVFDHFSPEVLGYKQLSDIKNGEDTAEKLTPNDVLLRDFYIFMYDNWNKCSPFFELKNKGVQPMFCMSTLTITPESSITSCETYKVNNEVKPVKIVFGNLNLKKNKWLDDYDCLSCEHMQRCSMGCFTVHMRDIRTQELCWLKEVYDYVDTKQ
jgi:radical SAM protein with 4Fe4S-binding SPASM domain